MRYSVPGAKSRHSSPRSRAGPSPKLQQCSRAPVSLGLAFPLVPFQLVSPKNACPRPWTERNLYPDRSPFGDRFGFVRPLLNFCVVRAKHLAQIVGTALEDALGALKSVFFALIPKLTDCSGCWDRPRDASSASADPDRPMDYRRLARRAVAAHPDRLAAAAARCACAA